VQPLASSACLAPERSPLVFPRLRAPTECACEREAIEPTGDAYRCRHQVIGVAKQTVADVGGVVAGLPQVLRLDLEAIPADMAFRAVVLAIDQPVLGSIPASHLTSSPQSTARVCLLP
jgi:hypothetical protein